MDPRSDPARQPLPESLAPMLATSAASLPQPDEGWAYEIKWDGFRMVALVAGGRVRLQSRTLLDSTADFPEVGALGSQLGSTEAVLDGEVVALDEQGRPSFGLLQQRGRARPPIVYMIFDLLFLDGWSTTALAYLERRRLLEGLSLAGPSWQVPAHHLGEGAELLEASRAQGLEGLVAKQIDSPYLPGQRSAAWRKVKNWARQELVIGGWMPGTGGRTGTLGSLLVGYHDATGALRYAGRVGTGFTRAELDRLHGLLDPLARPDPPFAEARALPSEVRRWGRFVEPRLVAEVAFSEWTHTGTIRQPSYQGLRVDKAPGEVVREG